MSDLHPRARTPICPTCGCSLVRLEVDREEAASRIYRDEQLLFCCDGCADAFGENPDQFLAEIDDVVVCPSCLAEKHVSHTIELEHGDGSVRLCRCPHCADAFREDPDALLQRLVF